MIDDLEPVAPMSETDNEAESPGNPPPIFILGMRPRTGTHFLANLLCQHPDCVKGVLAEDSLLLEAQLLIRYAKNMDMQWTQIAGKPLPGIADLLYESLGDGL